MSSLTSAQKRNMRRSKKAAAPKVTAPVIPPFRLSLVCNKPGCDSDFSIPNVNYCTHVGNAVMKEATRVVIENGLEPNVTYGDVVNTTTSKKKHRRPKGNKLPERPSTTAPITYEVPASTKALNRRERREEYNNRPEVKKYYADVAARKAKVEKLATIVAHPQLGLYLSSDPTVKYAECRRCKKRYEILKGSPLLNDEVQLARDDGYGEWWYLDADNECPDCSSSHISLGWCIITDTFDEDDDDDTHAKEMKAGKLDGKTALKKYKEDGRVLFGYNGYQMCLCNGCIRTFELGKYYHKLEDGDKIRRTLRDPTQPIYRDDFVRHGIRFAY